MVEREHVDSEQAPAFIRYPCDVPVRYRRCRQAKRRNGHANGVTPGGICFASGEPLEPGATLKLSLGAPHGVEHFTVRVAWCRPEGVEFLAGACLLDEGDACRARMLAQVCHIEAYLRRQRADGRDLDRDTAASEWITRYAHQVPTIT